MQNPLIGMLQNQMPMNGIMQRFQQFQQMFRGDPQQQIQQLMSTGKVNQQQYNQAVQMAQQFHRMIVGK